MVELTYLSLKKIIFLFIFSTYLIMFLLKFRSGELIGCGIWFRIQWVPKLHTFDGPRYPKNKKYLKKRDDDVGIKFCIQRALLIEIWVKTQWDMSKIRTKKVVFFNHYGWLILLKFYWFLNSISQKLILARFLIRPILDPKFPLMASSC